MFEILYQDDCLIAINKPTDILVHRSNIDKHETRFVLQELRNQIGQHVFPIHRLDKPTSGVLVFALDSASANGVAQQFEAGAVDKRYWLICRGFTDATGEIDYALVPKDDFKRRDGKPNEKKPAQEALTCYTTKAIFTVDAAVDRYPQARYSWVEAQLVTGRKHQLRRHFKHIGHPIIGDSRYGKSTHNRYFASTWGCERMLLHCREMSLAHPQSGQRIDLCADIDESFSRVLTALQNS